MPTFFMLLMTPLGFLTILAAFIYSTLTNKKHNLLRDGFYHRFGYIPDDISSYENGGVFFTFQKDIHFLLALVFKRDSFFVRNINEDLYIFIRDQPKSKTSWIKIKFSLLLLGVFILITDYATFLLFIKDVH